jgi:hypothetical protein
MNKTLSIEDIYESLQNLALAFDLDERQIYLILSIFSSDNQNTSRGFADVLALKYPKGNLPNMMKRQYGKTIQMIKERLEKAEGRLSLLKENQNSDLRRYQISDSPGP